MIGRGVGPGSRTLIISNRRLTDGDRYFDININIRGKITRYN